MLKSEAITDCANTLDTIFKGVLSKAQTDVQKRKPKFTVSTKFEKGEPAEKVSVFQALNAQNVTL